MSLPVVVFDTSALSFLIKNPSSEPHLKALARGFDVWLTAMSVDEIIATPVPETRETLRAGLQRLLASGRCVWPPHEILTLLCSAHASDPKVFDWRRVNIRTTRYERAIIDRDFTDDLCETQLREQRNVEESYMEFWQGLRAKLDPFLGSGPVNRPRSYRHAAEIARTGKVLSGLGKPLYQRGSKTSLDDAGIKAFMDACPPFRAICYGLVGTWFDVSLAPQVFKKLAGRNDQMMAVYLPYCSRFVTADGKQETRLREIAVEASLDCEVLSCNDFLASLEVLA
jgi:predicted nucleic acid-binding protein